MIRLAGLWFLEAGFRIRDRIQVDIIADGLRIQNVQNIAME